MTSLRFDPELLKRLDAVAEQLGDTNRTQLLERGARMVLAECEAALAKRRKR